MYTNIEIELYEREDGQKMLFIANDGSSGCKYSYDTTEQLKQIISNYVNETINYHLENK